MMEEVVEEREGLAKRDSERQVEQAESEFRGSLGLRHRGFDQHVGSAISNGLRK